VVVGYRRWSGGRTATYLPASIPVCSNAHTLREAALTARVTSRIVCTCHIAIRNFACKGSLTARIEHRAHAYNACHRSHGARMFHRSDAPSMQHSLPAVVAERCRAPGSTHIKHFVHTSCCIKSQRLAPPLTVLGMLMQTRQIRSDRYSAASARQAAGAFARKCKDLWQGFDLRHGHSFPCPSRATLVWSAASRRSYPGRARRNR